MSQYRVKQIHPVFHLEDGSIQIGDEPGFSSEVEDPTGFFKALLQLLDGTRTPEQMFTELSPLFPELLLEDVHNILNDLDEAGHLEATEHAYPNDESNRYLSNLNYLMNFSSTTVPPQVLQERLHTVSIAVVGLGGLGSNILMQLAGLGFTNLFAIEPDTLEPKNLNRQFLYRTQDVGLPKAEAAMRNLVQFNPDVRLQAVSAKINSVEDLETLIPEDVEVLICAADSPMLKIHSWCNKFALQRGIPLLAGGLGSVQGHYFTMIPSQTPCVECFYRTLVKDENVKRSMIYVAEHQYKNSAIAPNILLIASMITSDLLKWTLGLEVPSAGRRLLVDFLTHEVTPEDAWETKDSCICQSEHLADEPTFWDDMEVVNR